MANKSELVRGVQPPKRDPYAGPATPSANVGPEAMSDDEVIGYCWQKANQAINDVDDELSVRRQRLIAEYYGEHYGNERKGFSKQVTREVLETVEWALPSLLRVFLGGANVVSFSPEGEEDHEAAEQETDIINHLMFRQRSFYNAIRSWFKDGLLYPNGYLKVWWDETLDPVFTEYEAITVEQYLALQQEIDMDPQAGFRIMSADMDETTGMVSCTVREDRSRHELVLAPIPPEEVLVDDNLKSLDLDDAQFVCHYREPRRSDLVSEGYDPELVYMLPEAERLNTSTEREVRQRTTDEAFTYSEYDDGAQARVEVYECYLRLDVDGDGISELRKVVFSGKHMLENVYSDYVPIIAIGALPVSHRHVAISLAELSQSMQKVNSTLLRQLLDNLYRVNAPRTFHNGNVDQEQLMNYVPFGGVEADNPQVDVMQEQIPVAVQHILPAMQWLDEELGGRTGISKHTQGLDADTLAKSTMGAFMEALGQASQRMEMVAREFAEMGIRKLGLKMHHLMRKHQDVALSLKLNSGWVNVNPREWKTRTDMQCHVGTGNASSREQVAFTLGIMELQEKALAVGLTTPNRIYNAMEDLCVLAGKPGAERYFLDPASEEGQQMAAQQAEQQKMQELAAVAVQRRMLQEGDRQRQHDAEKEILKFQNEERKRQQQTAEADADREQKYAEMELDYQVDLANVGLKAGNVTPMTSGRAKTT